MLASLTAYRAVALDEVRRLARAAQADRPSRERGWSAEVTARRVAATEVSAALRMSEREAEQLIADSAAFVTSLPTTLSALREGRISYRHARVLVDEARSLPDSAWEAFEREALPEAETRTVGGFRQTARAVRERQHPDSLETRRRAAVEQRSVSVEPGRDGMAWFTAHLPAEQAIGAYRRLTEIAAGLAGPDAPRTLSQRRADVFADLLIDGVVADSGAGRGVRATVLVSVPALRMAPPRSRGTARSPPRSHSASRRMPPASCGCSPTPRPARCSRWVESATRCRATFGSGCGSGTRPVGSRGAAGRRRSPTSTTPSTGSTRVRPDMTTSRTCARPIISSSIEPTGAFTMRAAALSNGERRVGGSTALSQRSGWPADSVDRGRATPLNGRFRRHQSAARAVNLGAWADHGGTIHRCGAPTPLTC